jgi:hypothetical protein
MRRASVRKPGGLALRLDGGPVGDGFLARTAAEEPELRRHLLGVPRLDHLEVLKPLWRRGIGTALIRAAEDTARRLGHERLALAVGIDNPGAQRLYERLGYVDWDHGTIVGPGRSTTMMARRSRSPRPATCSSSVSSQMGGGAPPGTRTPNRCLLAVACGARPQAGGAG